MDTAILVPQRRLQGLGSPAQQQVPFTHHTQSSEANKPTSSLRGKESLEEKPNCAGRTSTADSSNHCWDHYGQVSTSLAFMESRVLWASLTF